VQRNAMRAFSEDRDFRSLLQADPDVLHVMSPQALDKAFDLEDQFRHVDDIFDRVFPGV
jgi:adenylosuccinate lyase